MTLTTNRSVFCSRDVFCQFVQCITKRIDINMYTHSLISAQLPFLLRLWSIYRIPLHMNKLITDFIIIKYNDIPPLPVLDFKTF